MRFKISIKQYDDGTNNIFFNNIAIVTGLTHEQTHAYILALKHVSDNAIDSAWETYMENMKEVKKKK